MSAGARELDGFDDLDDVVGAVAAAAVRGAVADGVDKVQHAEPTAGGNDRLILRELLPVLLAAAAVAYGAVVEVGSGSTSEPSVP